MITGTSLLKNGRVTGPLPSVKDLVKNKIVHAITASRYWSSSENSQNNSWNVNFSNGNFNNNNKYNSNMVRAVAALNDKYVEGWFDALDDCCAKKKTSSQCVMYRLIWHEDLLDLAREVYERTYRPTTSTCFIVTRPKLREVFAANFRDRIVQHWLCLRLEPLFEARFVEHGNVSFNCRKGFGTFACIDQLTKNTIEVSDNYSHEAWYAQFDIKGFFMSIDCECLLKYLLPFIKEKWNYWKGTIYEQDLDLVLWLTEVIVRHRPQDDCIRQGNLKLWRILPKNKSLFYIEWMRGEPIGNLTSQLFANFYMSFFDEWAIKAAEERGAKYVRFVDDFSFVCKTKEDAIYFKRASRNQLRYILNIQMHPNKIYIQEVKKGIKMVGGVIKPGRAYLSNRTVGNFINAVSYLEEACKNCDKEAIYANVRSINSYLGFLIHYQSYGIRRKAFSELHYFWKACYIQGKFQVVKIKKHSTMFITYNQSNEQPQRIRHNIKLGLRQYTIAFDVHIVKEGENEQYKWCEITLPVGTPTYSQLVSAIIHGRYSDDAMQAIINNYLLEDEDSEHQKEWNDMQMWRVEAKRMAKEILEEIKK